MDHHVAEHGKGDEFPDLGRHASSDMETAAPPALFRRNDLQGFPMHVARSAMAKNRSSTLHILYTRAGQGMYVHVPAQRDIMFI